MKLTATGCRISKKGNIITTIEKEAFKSVLDLGMLTKQNGIYYYFNRKQNDIFVYLP